MQEISFGADPAKIAWCLTALRFLVILGKHDGESAGVKAMSVLFVKLRFGWFPFRRCMASALKVIVPAGALMMFSGCAAIAAGRTSAPTFHGSARVGSREQIAPSERVSPPSEFQNQQLASTSKPTRITPDTATGDPIATLGRPAPSSAKKAAGASVGIQPQSQPAQSLGGDDTNRRLSPETTRSQQGPMLPGMEAETKATLDLRVRAPEAARIGMPLTYELTVENRTDATLEDVLLESAFDASLLFPGSDQKRARQVLGTMRPGESRTVALTLIAESHGNHCCRFAVSSQGREAIWKSVCVDVAQKDADLRLVGPTRRTVGGRAEFTAKIVNSSSEPWSNVKAIVEHPAALVPRDGSAGATQTPNSLLWELGTLEPGEGVQLQVEYECVQPGRQVCIGLKASRGDQAIAATESCLEIVSPKGGLQLQVNDVSDPLSVGEETEYLISVQNTASSRSSPVAMSVELPENLSVVSADVDVGTIGQGRPQALIEGNRVRLDVPAVPVRGEILFRVRAKAQRQGDGTLKVRILSSDGTMLYEQDEVTTVNR